MHLLPPLLLLVACRTPVVSADAPTHDSALPTCGGTPPTIDAVRDEGPSGCGQRFVLELSDSDGDLAPAVLWVWHDGRQPNVDAERIELPGLGGPPCTSRALLATVELCDTQAPRTWQLQDASGLRSELVESP
jgi:hypothetical protein